MKITKEQFAQLIKETYRSLKESVTLDSIKKEMEQFDWSYDYSDDNRAYTSGRAHEQEIRDMVKDYLTQHPSDKHKIVKMSDDIQRKKFNRSVFKGTNWVNESINEEKWEAKDGKVLLNNKKVYDYEFDRDSDAFWISDIGKSGQKAFDTKDEMFAYLKKHKVGIKKESVNEATVTSIPNFNLESDTYIEMLHLFKQNNAFKKIVAKVGEDYYTGGNPKNLFTVLHGGIKKIMNGKVISDIQAAVNKKRGPTFALTSTELNSPDILHKFSGVLALGVLSDLKEDPISFPKMIGDPTLIKAGSDFSANRGREKMGVMMGNRNKK